MTNAKKCFSADKLSKLALPCFLLAGLALFFLFDGNEFLSFTQLAEKYTSLKDFVDRRLSTALLIFGAAYILTVALSLPIASLLTLAGGALFGWIGAAVIIFVATIGATIVFISARTVLNEFFEVPQVLLQIEAGFQKNAFFIFCPAPDPRSPFLKLQYRPRLARNAPEAYAGNIHWYHFRAH